MQLCTTGEALKAGTNVTFVKIPLLAMSGGADDPLNQVKLEKQVLIYRNGKEYGSVDEFKQDVLE